MDERIVRLSKRIRWVGVVALLCAAVAAAAWTGAPQRWLVEWGVRAALRASHVQAKNVSLLGRAKIDSLRVYAPGARSEAPEPTLDAENLRVTYTLSPLRRRHITAVSLDRLRLSLDARDDAKTPSANAAPTADPDSPSESLGWRGSGWMPASVSVNSLHLSAALPWLGASLDGLSAEYSLRRGERLLAFAGENVTGQWWGEPNTGNRPVQGSLNLDFHETQYGVSIDPIRIELGEFITAHGMVRHGTERSRTELQLRLDDLNLGPIDWSAAAGKKAFPVAFNGLKLARVRVIGSWTGAWGSIADATFHGEANNLRIGPPGNLLYEGNLTLDVATPTGATAHFHSDVVFGKGQKASVDLDTSNAEFPTRITFANWTREQWLDLVPRPLRSRCDIVPAIGRISGDADLSYIVGGVYGKVAFKSLIGSGPDARDRSIELEIVEPPFWSPEPRKITATLGLPEQGKDAAVRVDFTGEPESSDSSVDVTLTRVQTENLGPALGMTNYLANCAATASGKLSLRQSAGVASGTVDLSADTFAWAGVPVPGDGPVSFKGHFDSEDSFATVAISGAELSTKSFAARVEKGTIAPASKTVHANASLKFDIETLAQRMGWGALHGTADIAGALAHDPQCASIKFTGAVSAFSWGDHITSQLEPLTLAGCVQYDYARREGVLKNLTARFGSGTTLTCDGATFASNNGALAIPFAAASDLQFFAKNGWVAAVVGHAKAAGALYREGEDTRCESGIDAHAESLALPNGAAAITGLALNARLTAARELSGDGTVRATSAALAGATFTNLTGALDLAHGAVSILDLAASVFGGTVNAAVTARLADEHRPVSVSGSLTALDLDVFTKEFKLSDAALTGIVRGEFHVELQDAALAALNVKLICDRGFTINKALIEQLLVTGAVKGFTGANTLEKVMAQIVGASNQRPFDSAELTLRYEAEGLKGQAVLRSKGLNLTIDLNIDPAALRAAIELRQQTQLDNVANVNAKPVQS